MLATKLHFIYHGITPLTVVAILNHSVNHQRRGPYYSVSCLRSHPDKPCNGFIQNDDQDQKLLGGMLSNETGEGRTNYYDEGQTKYYDPK